MYIEEKEILFYNLTSDLYQVFSLLLEREWRPYVMVSEAVNCAYDLTHGAIHSVKPEA